MFDRNWKAIDEGKRSLVRQGGTSSSKTFSNLQTLINIAKLKGNLLISVVSESMPHLKRGCIRDFENIMDDEFDRRAFNKTEATYTFPSKTKIEFFGADDAAKLRGGRRDIVFINEANNIPKESRDQLECRTKMFEIIDYNPVAEFWAHEMVGDTKVDFDISTYLDARHVLPKAIVDSIESRKDKDPNWWRVYGEGLTGKIEGLIFPRFQMIDQFPDVPCVYGVDFGYTNDPTAIVRSVTKGDTLYLDEMHFETGMQNRAIAKRLKQLGVQSNEVIYADCAEPKSIDAIREHMFNVKPCVKGRDSINAGIDVMHRYYIKVTKRSTNLIKELRNYRYDKDKEGKLTNTPIDLWNHCIDAVRYSVNDKIKRRAMIGAHRMRF